MRGSTSSPWGKVVGCTIIADLSDIGSLQSTNVPHGEPVEPRTIVMQE